MILAVELSGIGESHEDELVLPAERLAAIAEIGQIINSSSVTKDAFEKIGRWI